MNSSPSRLRGLLRDLTDGLAQQMFFWGRDVAHPDGNGLVRAGLQRIARTEVGGEGTSRYRLEREDGWIELHGFCAGWRPHDRAATGMLFVRRCHRIFLARGEMSPGRYDMQRLRGGTVDEMLAACGPFLRWWMDYEAWAADEFGSAWRDAAWRDYRKLRGARAWLAPEDALVWLRDFTTNPRATKRPREILRAPGLPTHQKLKTANGKLHASP
jgi:hypothetical protein